jgi:acyl-coenzyme A thioesterase PaaI-like protein
LADNPFAIDEQLAETFGVSVPTIRLDRATLNIPEARERIRLMATGQHDAVRALEQREVIGEIVSLKLNSYAESVLRVEPIHVFSRTGIMRGHFLFAQINSLATAVMDADIAVTARTNLKFHRPVRLDETLQARVELVGVRASVAKCLAMTKSGNDTVLDGVIWVAAKGNESQWTSVFSGGSFVENRG